MYSHCVLVFQLLVTRQEDNSVPDKHCCVLSLQCSIGVNQFRCFALYLLREDLRYKAGGVD